jgi:hypothetical protein
VTDYITMMALPQRSSLNTCRSPSSIVNLLVPGCSQPPVALTSMDLNHLPANYSMNLTLSPHIQVNAVAAMLASDEAEYITGAELTLMKGFWRGLPQCLLKKI